MKRFLFLSACIGFVFYEYVAARPAKAITQGQFSFNVKDIDNDGIADKIVGDNQKFSFEILFQGNDGGQAAGFTGVKFTTEYSATEVNPAMNSAKIAFAPFVDITRIKFGETMVMDTNNNNVIDFEEIMDAAKSSECGDLSFNRCPISLPFLMGNINPFTREITDQRIATVELTSLTTIDDGKIDVQLTNTGFSTPGGPFLSLSMPAFEIQPVPGPLPLLGLGAAFGYSRKLRKRLNISKSPKGTSIN